MCESAFSDWVFVLRLSYADSPQRDIDLAHKIITPDHFQRFIRSLRRRGHKIRYLAVGEYGDLFHRAHFHCILFGEGLAPIFPTGVNFYHNAWPHGHIYAQGQPDEKGIRYVVKYLFKTDGTKKWFTLSKKPALGNLFFMAKAKRDFQLGCVCPTGWSYLPPGGHPDRCYLMTGVTRRDYLIELARLSGIDLAVLAARSNEWVQMSLAKVDKYLREKSSQVMPLSEFLVDFEGYLDRERSLDRSEKLKAHLDRLPWLFPDGYDPENDTIRPGFGEIGYGNEV